MVANVDDKLGEIFLEDKLPTNEELIVIFNVVGVVMCL